VIIQEILESAEKKRTRTASGVEDAKGRNLPGGFSFREFSNRILYNVLHDIGWGVIYAPRLSHLRFFFNLGPMALSEPNDLSQELLIDIA
jgi:hypothetical protein